MADRGGRIDWGELALSEDGPDARAIGLSLLRPLVGSEPNALITSLTNDTVKAVRALHMRKEREETGLFLAEGLKIHRRGARSGPRAEDPARRHGGRAPTRCWTAPRPRP